MLSAYLDFIDIANFIFLAGYAASKKGGRKKGERERMNLPALRALYRGIGCNG